MTRKDELEMEKDAVLPEEIGTDSDGMGAATQGGYVNPYAGQIQELYQNISNRQPFQYDVDSDALYQALKDQYITGGKLAMMDTMGQAAQLTGGYGNSYAQGVGQQAYQGYLQGLNDQLPDLYNMALQNYIQTGDAMLQEYGMLQDMAADDYGKYQDQMALIQPQVLEMLQAGVRPSDEMIAASGLSKEYIEALYPEKVEVTGGGGAAPDTYKVTDEANRFLGSLPYASSGNAYGWKNYVTKKLEQEYNNKTLSDKDVIYITKHLGL